MTDKYIPTADNPLRIGTRQSPLAMAQAQMTAAAIVAAHGLSKECVQLVPMLLVGDKVQDRPLAEIGGKALWTKELERALAEREIDIAVHSMKDVETIRSAHFVVRAMLPRADIRDRLIGAASIDQLARGARVGTSSPRRAAQLLNIRPDLNIVSLRGNVATRLSKIANGEADATLLAAAGLDRLGMADTGHAIEFTQMLPAASQGAVGIDCLAERAEIAALLDVINHAPTFEAVTAERLFLEALGGDCHSPVAAHARHIEGAQLKLSAAVYAADGSARLTGDIKMPVGDIAAPAQLAARLLADAPGAVKGLFAASGCSSFGQRQQPRTRLRWRCAWIWPPR